jgi:hypothetical protein
VLQLIILDLGSHLHLSLDSLMDVIMDMDLVDTLSLGQFLQVQTIMVMLLRMMVEIQFTYQILMELIQV